uniref:Transcription activation suppressor b n=1 Tax=Denticeps clupeoides TaxID=299321 RepID=A0AAY4BM34_9TELE
MSFICPFFVCVCGEVPKPSGVPELPANHMPLLPWVNAFVPALHYALNKAHCNPTSDLSEGVQSQAREYLKGNHEGQQWPRVRLDYDTSDREHSATRQRVCFNWEGIMRSYIYNPNLYLIPIVKASNMMQDIPVSTSDQSGGKQGEQNPAMVKDLLTLIQMSKRKGEQDLEPTEAHGVKRKLDDEEGAVASKCARVEPVNNPTSMEGDISYFIFLFVFRCIPRISARSMDQPVALETEEESQPEQEVDSEQDAPRNLTDELKSSHWKEHCSSLLGSFDTIVDEQLSDFSAGMRELLRAERVYYNALSSPHDSRPPVQTPMRPFSEYVSHFYTPVPLYNYVRTLRSDLTSYIDSHVRSSCSTADSQIPSPRSPLHNTDRLPSRSHSQCPSSQASRPSSRNQKGALELKRPQPAQELSPAARPESLERLNGRAYADSAVGRASPQTDGSKRTEQLSRDSSGLVDCEPLSLSLTSVINQLNPEIITSLSAIIKGVQDNAIHFYVHSEENVISAELKDYLRRLGNSECNPWDYLKKNRMHSDKLLIITRNEDIADRVHTIPGLVTLKKMPSVSFAGVDSLDDIKNHTYNELFVSGGFIVSDDFVLNPDFITQGELQKLLEFLNHVNSPESSWRWKVHCKTLKKLREQSRVRRDALNLLKLLTEHQKKHMVDFLPYHDCDAPTHTTADLECLVKLQAQHTQHRHLIFLTERCLDLFPQHPRSGIVVASINDVLQSFTSLTGFHDVEKNSPLLDNQVSHTSGMITFIDHG